MPNERVHLIGPEQLEWAFRDSGPAWKSGKQYKREHKVDPFPCYPHDAGLVEKTLDKVEAIFPIKWPPDIYVLEYEDLGRTNGYADRETFWASGSGKIESWSPIIVLMGKRIPPHPGMTRYLVAHEYGHLVQWWLEQVRGIKDEATTELDREYMSLRPGSNNEYGGGRWDSNVGELIANDFRILVCETETEFWPHRKFPRPETVPAVVEFWRRAREQVWDGKN
jgi:hypothetical protein